jgi:hypothetical protein
VPLRGAEGLGLAGELDVEDDVVVFERREDDASGTGLDGRDGFDRKDFGGPLEG